MKCFAFEMKENSVCRCNLALNIILIFLIAIFFFTWGMVSFYSLIRVHMCVSNRQLFWRKNTKEVFLNLNVLISWYLGPHYNIHAVLYSSELRKRADGNCIQIAAYRIHCSSVPWVRHISNSRLQRIVHDVEVQHLSPIRNTIHDIISVMGQFNLQYYS